MDNQQRKRAIKLSLIFAAVLAGGLIYAGICIHTGWGIPCIIYKATGLQCAGCGVSRMCLSLLAGDAASAWAANPAVFILSPAFALLLAVCSARYVKRGKFDTPMWGDILLYVIAAIMVAFMVYRNIPAITGFISTL